MATSLAFDIIARDRASKEFDKVGKSADGMGSKLAKAGKIAAIGVGVAAAGAVVAGKALYDMAKGAAEDEAAQKRLAVALRNNAHATKAQVSGVEDWITAQGKAKGVADDDLRPALGRLAAATHSVRKSQKLTALAMDVSAGSGKSLDAVTTALAKAQKGSLGGLSRLGVATKNADGSTRSLRDITKDLAKTYAGQATAAANTTAGKWKRLKLQFDETKESIGAKLLPIGAKAADFLLNKLGPAAGKVGDWVTKNLIPPLRQFGQDIAPKVHDVMAKVKQAFQDAQPFFQFAGKVFLNVLWPAFKKVAEIALPLVGKQIQLVGKYIGVLGKVGIWLWNNAFGPTIRFLLKGFAMVTEGWAIVLRGLSHVPGFGWAKKAADSMDEAARKAKLLADNIKDIKDKDVHVNVHYTRTLAGATTAPGGGGKTYANAAGTNFSPGGETLVGEQGPERVILPRGARVQNAAMTRDANRTDAVVTELRALRRILEQAPIVRVSNAGRGAYLRTGD